MFALHSYLIFCFNVSQLSILQTATRKNLRQQVSAICSSLPTVRIWSQSYLSAITNWQNHNLDGRTKCSATLWWRRKKKLITNPICDRRTPQIISKREFENSLNLREIWLSSGLTRSSRKYIIASLWRNSPPSACWDEESFVQTQYLR